MSCCLCKGVGLSKGSTPTESDVPTLDDILRRVSSAGGEVNGYLRVTMYWESWSDLDLWVRESIPVNGEVKKNTIYYSEKVSGYTRGELDVDMNVDSEEHPTDSSEHANPAVENIIYKDKEKVKPGDYSIGYTQYGVYGNRSDTGDLAYILIELRNNPDEKFENFIFLRKKPPQLSKSMEVEVCNLTYTEREGFVVKSLSEDVEIIKVKNFAIPT